MCLISKTILQPLFNTLELGQIQSEPEAVSGGLIHLMWKVATDQNSYAVKQLNPIIMQRPDIIEDYNRSEQIASEFADNNVAVICALSQNSNFVFDCGDARLMIYPWCEGETLSYTEATSEQCFLIGQIMGRMHALDLKIDDLPTREYKIQTIDHLNNLTDQATEIIIPWAFEITNDLPLLSKIIPTFENAVPYLLKKQVISHRDMDIKNIIWQSDSKPLIIDWESAGYANPTVELLESALDWSGQWSGRVEAELFQQFLKGYRSECSIDQIDFDHAILGCYCARIDWLEFNMSRTLDEQINMQEQFLAENEVTVTLNSITILNKNQDKYRTWFNEIFK